MIKPILNYAVKIEGRENSLYFVQEIHKDHLVLKGSIVGPFDLSNAYVTFPIGKPEKRSQKLLGMFPIMCGALARITRKITGRKGTPLEIFLMETYYNLEYRILGAKR